MANIYFIKNPDGGFGPPAGYTPIESTRINSQAVRQFLGPGGQIYDLYTGNAKPAAQEPWAYNSPLSFLVPTGGSAEAGPDISGGNINLGAIPTGGSLTSPGVIGAPPQPGGPMIDTGAGPQQVNIGKDVATGYNAPGQGFFTPQILQNQVKSISDRLSRVSQDLPSAIPTRNMGTTPTVPSTAEATVPAVPATPAPATDFASFMDGFRNLSAGGTASATGSTRTPEQQATEQLATFNTAAGVTAAQNDLTTAKQDLSNFEQTLLAEADKIKGQKVSTVVIGRRLVRLDAETAENYRQKQANVQLATDKLNMSNSQVSQLISLTQFNTQETRQKYEFEANKALQFYQLYQTEQNKQQSTMQAAVAGFLNVAKDNPDILRNASASDRAEWNSWEISAGFPKGYVEGLLSITSSGQASGFEFKGTVGNENVGWKSIYFNPQTGEQKIMDLIGGTGGEDGQGISDYQFERGIRNIDSVSALITRAKVSPGIFGRTAAAPIPDFLRSDAFRNFQAELSTLKANIAFGELTAMREASKTGGALGQVSDREGKLLQDALGALDMAQSPENVIAQLNKVRESIERWDAALAIYGGLSSGGVDAPQYLSLPEGFTVEQNNAISTYRGMY